MSWNDWCKPLTQNKNNLVGALMDRETAAVWGFHHAEGKPFALSVFNTKIGDGDGGEKEI